MSSYNDSWLSLEFYCSTHFDKGVMELTKYSCLPKFQPLSAMDSLLVGFRLGTQRELKITKRWLFDLVPISLYFTNAALKAIKTPFTSTRKDNFTANAMFMELLTTYSEMLLSFSRIAIFIQEILRTRQTLSQHKVEPIPTKTLEYLSTIPEWQLPRIWSQCRAQSRHILEGHGNNIQERCLWKHFLMV